LVVRALTPRASDPGSCLQARIVINNPGRSDPPTEKTFPNRPSHLFLHWNEVFQEVLRMSESALTPRLKAQLGVLSAAGIKIPDAARILDLGCGEGDSVRALRAAGFDARGCDIALRDTPKSRELIAAGVIREIPMRPYRLPFDDGEFDLVLSDEVLEHVMNYEDFIAENRRVQKIGGASLHLFPGPWTPIEMHTYVPLASIHRSFPWLLAWAALGVRNEFQRGLDVLEVARRNYNYLRSSTNYVTTPEVRRLFERKFSKVEFREDLFLKLATSGRAGFVNKLVTWFPFLMPVYRNLHNRVLIARA
jgi:SAM-dependent methyltransferase